jgi:hypothetical protein
MDRLVALLERLGTSPDAIAGVLMTHLHGDHFNPRGLRAFVERRRRSARPFLFHLHRDEPLPAGTDLSGIDPGRFGDEPFEIPGRAGALTVQPVRMTHTPGCSSFRIGDDYLGCDASLLEVFSDRVLAVINPPAAKMVGQTFLSAESTMSAQTGMSAPPLPFSQPVRSLFLDMEALDRETVLRSGFPETRKRNILETHGFVTDMIAVMERPELRGFFEGLERLVCLHVTPGVNDPSGRENARLISGARDRLGFTFDVPVVPAGIQD